MSLDRSLLFRLATSSTWERAVRALPPTEALARRAAATYVAGDSLQDALGVAEELHGQGVSSSIDRFGELETDHRRIDSVVQEYRRLAAAAGDRTWLWARRSRPTCAGRPTTSPASWTPACTSGW